MIYRLLAFIKARPNCAAAVGAVILTVGPIVWMGTLLYSVTRTISSLVDASSINVGNAISPMISIGLIGVLAGCVSMLAGLSLGAIVMWRVRGRLPYTRMMNASDRRSRMR